VFGRILIWCLAIPASFVLVVVPTIAGHLITRNEVVDLFTAPGSSRYTPFVVFAVVWAVFMASVVTFFAGIARRLRVRHQVKVAATRSVGDGVTGVSVPETGGAGSESEPGDLAVLGHGAAGTTGRG
jgi:hypothetical protein